jgi:hypothetical protein
MFQNIIMTVIIRHMSINAAVYPLEAVCLCQCLSERQSANPVVALPLQCARQITFCAMIR